MNAQESQTLETPRGEADYRCIYERFQRTAAGKYMRSYCADYGIAEPEWNDLGEVTSLPLRWILYGEPPLGTDG